MSVDPATLPTADRLRHFEDHRRAFRLSAVFVGLFVCMLVAVGRHPTTAAPVTTVPTIGRVDARVEEAFAARRTTTVTAAFEGLDLAGSGVVTIPLRIALVAVLFLRRRVGAAIAFMLTWLTSELVLRVLKVWFARGRPPAPLVEVSGFSFPSGHATAAAAIGVSIVLAFLAPGRRRRRWEILAALAALLMASSRVYLGAHWLSDVVTGVLMGASAAVLSFGLVDEVRHRRERSAQSTAEPS
ncbi:MAG TPA: phosphatase PAP2 family protein [Actinomycetota bacterium]